MARHDLAPDTSVWHDEARESRIQRKARARRGRRRNRRPSMKPMDAYIPRIRSARWITKSHFKRHHPRAGRYGWHNKRIR